MSIGRSLFDRPDLDQNRQRLPLLVVGAFADARPGDPYEGRLQIRNAIGDCTVDLLDGDLPPGYSLSVDNGTKEVVLAWPAFEDDAAPILNPGFESGVIGWEFSAGWEVTNDNSIAGVNSARYSGQSGDSMLVSTSRFPVQVGQHTIAQCLVRQGASSKGNAGGAVRLQYRDAVGNIVRENEGNIVQSASDNAVFPSTVEAFAPEGSTQVNIALRGIRNRQNLAVWVDSFSWDHQATTVGINEVAVIPLVLRVRDSAGRSYIWTGTVNVADDPVLAASPIFYLPMNDLAGSSIAQNIGTVNYQGVYNALGTSCGADPILDNGETCAEITGPDGKISWPDGVNWDQSLSAGCTWGVVVQRSAYSGIGHLFTRDSDSLGRVFQFRINGTDLELYALMSLPTVLSVIRAHGATVDEPQLFEFSYDSTSGDVRLRRNGSLLGAAANIGPGLDFGGPGTDMRIGNRATAGEGALGFYARAYCIPAPTSDASALARAQYFGLA